MNGIVCPFLEDADLTVWIIRVRIRIMFFATALIRNHGLCKDADQTGFSGAQRSWYTLGMGNQESLQIARTSRDTSNLAYWSLPFMILDLPTSF